MIKVKSCTFLLCFLLLFSGCANNPAVESKAINTINPQENSSKIKAIPFEYLFKGFMTLKDDQVESYPHGTYIIETEEDWFEFMGLYLPGIPYDVSVDFAKESLVFNVLFTAKPSYASGYDIKTFVITDDKLEPEYTTNKITGESNNIYAQNANGVQHCFVSISKIAKSDIPKEVKDLYHKGDVFKN